MLSNPPRPGSQREQPSENDAGGNGRALEISNLISACRERLRRNVKACQPADTAADEVNQRNPIPAATQSGGKTESRGGSAKGENVCKGIQFPPQRRMLVPPPCNAPIEHVK